MMHDDKKPSFRPGDAPASEQDLNRPGMTNGVPDEHDGAEAKGSPHDERGQSERAAGRKDGEP